MRNILTLGGASFESSQKRFGDLFVGRLGEEQRDVDIDAFFQRLANCRKTLRRGRNLDHDVRAADGFPEPACLLDSGLGVKCQVRGNFETHVAVAALGFGIDGPENIRRILHVTDRDLFVQYHRA